MTDDFTVSEEDQEMLDDAAENGEGAEGTYTYDEDTGALTITIETSSFDCGPEVGTVLATVESMTATELTLKFDEEGGSVVWTRVDKGGEGIVGIWFTADPGWYLILGEDGGAQIFGEQELCDEDRPRNGNNCLLVEPSESAITIDGALGDWAGVGQAASIEDPTGDHDGDDEGADFTGLRVAFDGTSVHVLVEIPTGPSTSFQNGNGSTAGSYRLTVQGDNALSEQATMFYNPGDEAWEVMGYSDNVEAAAGEDGLEWSIDVSDAAGEGFEEVDFIFFESQGCNEQECGRLDDGECAYFEIAK